MLPDENPPPHLEAFREFAEERGQRVHREYHWGGPYTDEDGHEAYSEPGWDTLLVKEAKQDDDRLVMHCLSIGDQTLEGKIWEAQWAMLIELNEKGFERTLEEHGYSRQRDS